MEPSATNSSVGNDDRGVLLPLLSFSPQILAILQQCVFYLRVVKIGWRSVLGWSIKNQY
jgi:hypothetical protein